jgi:hypothetical protein
MKLLLLQPANILFLFSPDILSILFSVQLLINERGRKKTTQVCQGPE